MEKGKDYVLKHVIIMDNPLQENCDTVAEIAPNPTEFKVVSTSFAAVHI